MEFLNKSKIKWLLIVIKKHSKLDKLDFSKVKFGNNIDEIVPVKTQITDKEGNSK